MKAVLTGFACVLAVIVVLVVVRGQIDTDSGSSGLGSGTGGPGPGGQPVVTTSVTPEVTATPDVTPSATPDSTGTPTVTQRGTTGTDRVDCSSIDSELKISAYGGMIRWNAASASGVSVSPSSGFLDEGESEVVRVGGSYSDGEGFTVVVSAPNQSGSGSVNYPFTCV
ncbi:hypothetical protein [Frankia sp. EAN1pec]|uniref:hypothetical protein n=1 Tax=Parafrankia sp. (strain EAN1pec) TaxID=298653 RepID=UPI00031C8E9B